MRPKWAAPATLRRTKTAQQLSVALAFGGSARTAASSSSSSSSAAASAPASASSSSSDAAGSGSSSGSGSGSGSGGPHSVNVLVSNGHLLATLAKLMLYGLHSFFPVENVYSSAPDLDITTGTTRKSNSASASSADSKTESKSSATVASKAGGTATKDAVFNLIFQRFGSSAEYTVIGDSNEEETASKRVLPPNTRFWKVRAAADLEALTKALS